MPSNITPERTYAAIDIGSNSFHMAVARTTSSHLQMIDKLRNPVRLGSGLDKKNNIKADTMQRALDCLATFEQRLRGVPRIQFRAVGTNTMRRARNAAEFALRAEETLGVPIEVISGREEARLIYAGVTFGTRDTQKRLVIDIGGGSTELIIGDGTDAQIMESVNMGCVSYTQQWFSKSSKPDSKKHSQFKRAIEQAQLELLAIEGHYHHSGWDNCTGSSGTIKATERLLTELGLCNSGISRSALEKLVQQLDKKGPGIIDAARSISDDRKQVIVGGLCVLLATFRSLNIEFMNVSHSALREGVIIDLAGEPLHEHVKRNAIADMQRRFQTDLKQVARLNKTARKIFRCVREEWGLSERRDLAALLWACELHEVGLSVAHVQYHKHGDYLLRNADMLGFARNDQALIASLVRNHRRKIYTSVSNTLQAADRERYLLLLVILRLAILFHRTRNASETPPATFTANGNCLKITIAKKWLTHHPLTHSDLLAEQQLLGVTGIELEIMAE